MQVVIGVVIIMGSMITLLSFAVRESGAALQDLEEFEGDEPV